MFFEHIFLKKGREKFSKILNVCGVLLQKGFLIVVAVVVLNQIFKFKNIILE